jgi:SM-20-related protein
MHDGEFQLMLNLSKLAAAEFHTEPFEYLVVDDFVKQDAKQAIVQDFPQIEKSGSFPLSRLSYGPAFRQLTDELLGPDFAAAVGEKFSMGLSQYPTMLTVRGQCDDSDGQIHTDSKDKVITVLLYLNQDWDGGGGRLRLLRSKNLEDYVAEVPPTMGSLIIFKRSERSWHGHKPFEGKRMSLQMNWVTSDRYMRKERLRHEVSSFVKGLVGRKS